MMSKTRFPLWLAVGALAAGLAVVGCGGGSSSGGSSSEAAASMVRDVPLAYVKRVNTLGMNPTDGAPSAPGGDLMVREKSSPSAPEHNLTAKFTQGKGDASDPEVSYDGKKIVFAMRCPSTNTSTIDGQPACTGRWNIWEYDMSSGGLTGGSFRRLTASTADDDVDPAYLPAGRGFVFSSNRQTKSKALQAVGSEPYFALDEYERERVLNLHTMNAAGAAVEQISFNQSHDRNPVVRPNGDIMFSRWEHVGPRNRFAIFRTKPDGTDMFVLYGAQSPGNSFLHPRDMDPKGKYKGFVSSSLMSLSGTQEGGALMFIDAANYSEYNTPANSAVPTEGGQSEVTDKLLNMGRGLSLFGRITSPYPLWDGSNRVLLSYRPCEVTRDGVVVPCATLSAAEIERLNDRERTMEAVAADGVAGQRAAVVCGVHVRSRPADLAHRGRAAERLHVHRPGVDRGAARTQRHRSDQRRPGTRRAEPGADRGAQRVRHRRPEPHGRRHAGRGGPGRRVAPWASPRRGRWMRSTHVRLVADLVRMKDPADSAYGCAPARFVRATRAVAPPSSTMGLRSAIGETEFEQQQILGYAPIEPDGSFKLQVPADVPLALAVVDAKGRGIQTHLNWIQVRPGERRTCDGCHSPRRGGAINSGEVVNTLPAALQPGLSGQHRSGETMAALRTRLDATLLRLKPDMEFSDVWADTSQARRRCARADRRALHRQCRCDTRPGHARAGERPDQLPAAYPADLEPRPRRQYLYRLPRRQRQAGPARHRGGQRPARVVRRTAARRPGHRSGHGPARDAAGRRRADGGARRAAGRDHGAAMPPAWHAAVG